MKTWVVLTSAVAMTLVSSVCGQSLLLNPGESYTFSFNANSLPPAVPSPFGNMVFAGYDLVANGGGKLSCHWLVEMFENNVSESPISVIEQELSEDCSLQPTVAGAWQDLQGMVRVTAITQTLVSPMEVEITVPSANGFLYYDGYVAVPEPDSCKLMVLFGTAGILWHIRRRVQATRPKQHA